MLRRLSFFGFAILSSHAIFAQSGGASPEFGIADVHARPPNSIRAMRSGFSHGIYELRNATMLDLIRTAWGVAAENVLGGPAWLELDRFDVVATVPEGATPETRKAMLRTLLEVRFRLAAHEDSRAFPVYALTASKKLQLEEGNPAEDAGCRPQPGKTPPPRNTPAEPVTYICRNMTMPALAASLAANRGAAGYLFNYRVVDQTGLQGGWNFTYKWSLRGPGLAISAPGTAITLFDALEKQLGLKLELARVPTPVVVVDSVNETPAPNPSGVVEKLAAPVMEFEVAEIKTEDPNSGIKGSSVRIDKGGLVRINMTLKGLIEEAWNDFDPDRILGGPKSVDVTRFAVTAKAPATDLASDGAVFSGIDIDSMRMMLKALLIDRFKLVAHNEDRQVSGYVLLAGKPKLRKAAAGNRPGCKEGPADDGKDPRIANPIASRLVTCRNVTLTQFAAELRNIAETYLYRYPPVADLTKIEGSYDITINFSQPSALQAISPPTAGQDAVASEPNGAISLFDAIDRQLGLKLEIRKVTAPVLVIDHVDEMPSEN